MDVRDEIKNVHRIDETRFLRENAYYSISMQNTRCLNRHIIRIGFHKTKVYVLPSALALVKCGFGLINHAESDVKGAACGGGGQNTVFVCVPCERRHFLVGRKKFPQKNERGWKKKNSPENIIVLCVHCRCTYTPTTNRSSSSTTIAWFSGPAVAACRSRRM